MTPSPTNESASLRGLRGFGVAFGSQVVLDGVDLALPERGVLLLLGSAGEGKSTLLRTMAGLNDAQPSLRTWGDMNFPGGRPTLVRQNARLLLSTLHENLVSGLPTRSSLTRVQQSEMLARHLHGLGLTALEVKLGDDVSSLPRAEQRLASIARALLADPECLLLDEPTAGLMDDEAGAERIIDLLLAEAEKRVLVVTTHNQRHAQRLGGEVALLADRTIHQRTPTHAFFTAPASPAAQMFVRSGRCSLVPRDSERDPEIEPVSAPSPVSRTLGPQGFYWIIKGQLGGAPRPGITSEVRWDFEALARLGTTVLISLEERLFYDPSELEPHGIRSIELRIDDMGVPTLEEAAEHCRMVEGSIATGGVVVVHCRAGLGRTGTMLAAQLIWRGTPPAEALEQARSINPKWVQSDRQILFLSEFFAWIQGGMPPATSTLEQENIK